MSSDMGSVPDPKNYALANLEAIDGNGLHGAEDWNTRLTKQVNICNTSKP